MSWKILQAAATIGKRQERDAYKHMWIWSKILLVAVGRALK